MFIVPYIKRPLKPGLQQIWIFLERNGTHLIEVGADAATFAIENGFSNDPTFVPVGDLLLLAVDPSPSLSSFYSWGEVPPGTIPMKELWRPFMCLEGANQPLSEIPLSLKHTALSVITPILSLPAINIVDECKK
jgi:hypothetical protein